METVRDQSDNLSTMLVSLHNLAGPAYEWARQIGPTNIEVTDSLSIILRWPERSPEEALLGRSYTIQVWRDESHEYEDKSGDRQSRPSALELTFSDHDITEAGIRIRDQLNLKAIKDEKIEGFVVLVLAETEKELIEAGII